jgi:hypothetical protein
VRVHFSVGSLDAKENIDHMPPVDPTSVIAPLSLSNVITMLCALLCFWTTSPQAHGGVWRLWRLATPAAFAAVVALMLLSAVFEATWQHDVEWLVALVIGGLIGRARGWAMPVEIDQNWGLVRLPRAKDVLIAASGIVAMSVLDFSSAVIEEVVLLAPEHIAAGSALFAGFIGCRALAIIVRSTRAPHVGLRDMV